MTFGSSNTDTQAEYFTLLLLYTRYVNDQSNVTHSNNITFV